MAMTTQQLFKAVHIDDQAAVKRALSINPALVHAKHPRDAHTPLHSAAASGNLPLLKELLHHGASCQTCDFNNETPLHLAARQGQLLIVKELLRDAGRRFCLRSLNRDGATPLHLAAAAGHTDVVQMLLNAGARGDLKDRAGRTPLDLVNAEQPELAEILLQGRQLTPGSGGRSRRIISPGVSPTPFQNMPAASPSKLAMKSSQLQQQEPDTKAAADATLAGRNTDLTADLPRSMNTVITSGVDDIPEVAYAERQRPPAVRVGQHDQGPQTIAGFDQDTQKENLATEQSWLQYSPQRPMGGTFSRGSQQEMQSNCQPSNFQRDVAAATSGSRFDMLQSPASVLRSPMRVLQPGLAGTSSYTSGGLSSQYPQQQRPQQQQQPSRQLGPLRSARAAGPVAAGAAAAAAVSDLTKSFECHPTTSLTASSNPQNAVGPLKQQASTLSALGGVNHIVSPETSSGLLAGSSLTPQHSSRDYHAAPATAVQPMPMQPPAYDSFENNSGALLLRKSLNQLPSGVLSHQTSQQHTQPPLQAQHSQQQEQFAALAAAVSASSRVGPLQLPVQSQLNELSNKVQQLEEWFEAQVELIPEWQKVLAVVQGVKRQGEEQKYSLLEVETKCQGHSDSLEHLATQVAKLQGVQASTGNEMTQMRSGQDSMKWTLGGMNEQIRQLESQLVHQASTAAARMGTTESLVATVSREVGAVTDRLSTLENATKAVETQMHTAQQQVTASRSQTLEAVEATCESTASSSAAASRIAVLELSMAEMKRVLQELQQAKPLAGQGQPASSPASTQTEALAQTEQPESGQSAIPAAAPQTELLEELNELKQRVSDLSVCVSGMDYTTALQAPEVEDTILPFMETTSNCLQQHEQQLDAIQAVVPKLETVVAQRDQMCELMQQMAALQTAFSLLTGGKDTLSGRSTSGVLSAGPLSAQKAAADYLAMATNMVKLQTQMGALSSAVEDLHNEWEGASAAMKTEQEAIRSAWESERSRMSAAEREAVRRLADQQKGLKAREQKLIEIREAAIAEEAAKHSQLESESRVTAALNNMTEQQQAMRTKIIRLTEAGEAITAATEALKQQMGSLQAEMAHLLADLWPRIEQTDALNGMVDNFRQEVAHVKALEAKMEDIQPRAEKVNTLEQKLNALKPSGIHVNSLEVQAITLPLDDIYALEENFESTKSEADAAKAEAAAASRTSAFAAAQVAAARASAFAASMSTPAASMRSEPASPSILSDGQALDGGASPGASTHAVSGTPWPVVGSHGTPSAAAPSAEADNLFLCTPMSLWAPSPAAAAAGLQNADSLAPPASPSSYFFWQRQLEGSNGAVGSSMPSRSTLEPAGPAVADSSSELVPPVLAIGADVSNTADDIKQNSQAQPAEPSTSDTQMAASKKLSWFSKTKKRKSKHVKLATDQSNGVGQHDAASMLLPETMACVSGDPVAAAAPKPNKWAKRWQKLLPG